jgi:hypothetical protein
MQHETTILLWQAIAELTTGPQLTHENDFFVSEFLFSYLKTLFFFIFCKNHVRKNLSYQENNLLHEKFDHQEIYLITNRKYLSSFT